VELNERLQELGLVVGRIVEVAEHPGARAPSHLLTIDLGPKGRHQATVPRGPNAPEDLEGTQVVCAPRGDEVLVLVAHSHAAGAVLLRPDRDVEEGSVVG
jgi:tRNA-binding protein